MIAARMTSKMVLARADAAGRNIRQARNEFARLLPVIDERRLYRRRKCGDVFEFARKVACMSAGTVKAILSVWRGLQGKPRLKALFEEGRAGWSAIRVVLAEATPRTDAYWAGKVLEMSKHELEAFVRSRRGQRRRDEEIDRARARFGGSPPPKPGVPRPEPTDDVLAHLAGFARTDRVPVDIKVAAAELFQRFRLGLEKERGRRVSASAALMELVAGYGKTDRKAVPLKVVVYKEADTGLLFGRSQWGIFRVDPSEYPEAWEEREEMSLAREVSECEEVLAGYQALPGERRRRRHVPKRVRRLLEDMYDGFCGFPGCNDRVKATHHPLRLLYQVRSIWDLVPLCDCHHTLAHLGCIEGEGRPPDQWRVRDRPEPETEEDAWRDLVDTRARRYRTGHSGGSGSL